MRLPDARTPRPLELIEAEIKGLEEDFEAAQGGNGVESRTERTKSDRNDLPAFDARYACVASVPPRR
jgi:hypothetical protein